MRNSAQAWGLLLSMTFACGCSDAGSGDDAGNESGGTNAKGGGGGNATSGGASSSGGTAGAGGNATGGTGGSAVGGTAGNGGASGGSAGTGGSGNSNAGGPPVVIGDCGTLGEVDEWQEITPPDVDASQGLGTVSVSVDHINSGTLYVGTDNQGFHKSTDCGATWTKINTGTNGELLDTGVVWEQKIDPIDSNILYAASLYGPNPSLLKSTDAGVSWASLAPPGSIIEQTVAYNFHQNLGIDITNHEHLVTTFHADCSGEFGPMCLAESTDAGASWRIFKGPTPGWGERAGVIVFDATSYLFHTWADGIYYTSDSGESWENVGGGSNFQMYKATDGLFYLGSVYGLMSSPDGYEWTDVEGENPPADGIAGDGARIFASWGESNPTYAWALESDPTTWTTMTHALPHRATGLQYDDGHHLLYAANTNDGIWRMVTK